MDFQLYSLAVSLRRELHAHPEPSDQETWTKTRLLDFLRTQTALELHDEGAWFYAVHRGRDGRPGLVFRADFDALPIPDESGAPYASRCPGLGHQCGHDGHSAALAAFALLVDRRDPPRTVYFLFQNAEETGDGAKRCLALLEREPVEAVYGFHNMPGYPLYAVCLRPGPIHCASRGMTIRLTGVSTHASTPELGRSPALAVARLVEALPSLTDPAAHRGLVLATVIQMDVGEPAFGVAAHRGALLLTLRAQYEEELDALQAALEDLTDRLAQADGLEFSFSYCDVFPETVNTPACVEAVRAAAEELGLTVVDLPEPARCSEDFGWYTKRRPGAFFFLGDGEDHPPLHSTTFDFPDPLIATACDLFWALL